MWGWGRREWSGLSSLQVDGTKSERHEVKGNLVSINEGVLCRASLGMFGYILLYGINAVQFGSVDFQFLELKTEPNRSIFF